MKRVPNQLSHNLITLRQAAELLGVHPETLRRWDRSGQLKAVRIGKLGHRRYALSSIAPLVNQRTASGGPAIPYQLSMFGEPHAAVREVDRFPLENIPVGAIYMFSPETANKVTDWTHGMHVYPAKFIPQIPRWSFDFARLRERSAVLDPFCGCGTTLVEAAARGFKAYGVDINPLAVLLTKAKTTPLYTNDLEMLAQDVDKLIVGIRAACPDINEGTLARDFNLHPNWEFWFPASTMARLLAIKSGIAVFRPDRDLDQGAVADLRRFYLACFSSIIKKCSFFNEREIKVRKDRTKTADALPDPVNLLSMTIKKNLPGLVQLSGLMREKGSPPTEIAGKSATDIQLPESSIDLVVTSPPYVNAIDYAMAHKYSLFLLDLVTPEGFKDHCREYIGVTERAVRASEYSSVQPTGNDSLDELIAQLHDSPSPVDKIRAYIVSEYFIDMRRALLECFRVLKPNSYLIFVAGDNTIRRRFFPTSALLQDIATWDVGFELVSYFYHQLRNIRLKVKRNTTGGQIKRERVMILRKP